MQGLEQNHGPAKRVSKVFFLGSMIGAAIVAYIFGALSLAGGYYETDYAWPAVIVFVAAMVYIVAINVILWHKAWAAIQDGHTRTTPLKAVGFAFIPLFNLYWIFQLVWGFARDHNAYILRHNLRAKNMPEGLFLTAPILAAGSAMGLRPHHMIYDVYVYNLAQLIVYLAIVNKVCDAINALAEAESSVPHTKPQA